MSSSFLEKEKDTHANMATPAGDAITLTDTPSKHGSVDLAADRDEVKSEGAAEGAAAEGEAAAPVQDQSGVLHGMRLFLVFLAMMLSVFVSRRVVCWSLVVG